MATLTNKYNIPQQIVSAIMRDPYSRGRADISVTQLIQPPRIIQLKQRFEQEIEEDASDRIWALLGQVCHNILERSDDTGAIHEERISVEVDGWTVSGQSDCYVTQQFNFQAGIYEDTIPTIRDYKFTKIMAADFDHPEWEEQVNLLAYLWRDKGFPVERVEIVTIYRDWSKVIAQRGNYPPPVQTFKQRLWPIEKQEAFIRQQVMLHRKAAELPDNLLPLCTPEDQWRKKPKWAVMHPKKVRAVKLLDSHQAAEDFCKNMPKPDKSHYIQHRPAQALRCQMFCDVAAFCDQFKAEQAAEGKKEAA